MIDWTATVSLQFVVGAVFLSAVLLLVLLLGTVVYFAVRLKLLASRVASLEFELKAVAEKLGLITVSKPPPNS